jgi:hypothetical protein
MTHAATTPGAASPLVAALERAWTAIRTHHPDVPAAVVIVASGGDANRLALGHFAPGRWQVNGTGHHEVLIGAEGLARGPDDVLTTLLHEAAHGLANARGIQDTSRQGRYHNHRYATLAAELGLDVARDPRIGWSLTTLAQPTAQRYAAVLAELRAALVLWRYLDHPRRPHRHLAQPARLHLPLPAAHPHLAGNVGRGAGHLRRLPRHLRTPLTRTRLLHKRLMIR